MALDGLVLRGATLGARGQRGNAKEVWNAAAQMDFGMGGPLTETVLGPAGRSIAAQPDFEMGLPLTQVVPGPPGPRAGAEEFWSTGSLRDAVLGLPGRRVSAEEFWSTTAQLDFEMGGSLREAVLGSTGQRVNAEEFWSTAAQLDFKMGGTGAPLAIASQLQSCGGASGSLPHSMHWSTEAAVDFQKGDVFGQLVHAHKQCWKQCLTGILAERVKCKDVVHMEPSMPPSNADGLIEEEEEEEHRKTFILDQIPAHPFPADFNLSVRSLQFPVCRHLCQPHANSSTGIAMFLPGAGGGVGPGRRPGSDFDPAGLFFTVVERLLGPLDAPVDCYRLSWPHANPDPDLAVAGTLAVLQQALQTAQRLMCRGRPHEFPVFLIGHSFGGAVALEAAEALGRAGCTAVFLHGLCTLNTARLGRLGRPVGCRGSLSGIRALLVAGDADEVVDPRATLALHGELPTADKQLLLLPGGRHELYEQKAQLAQEVSSFIVRGLPMDSSGVSRGH